ncbi:MAG: SDR family oxidoreductase [Gemmatimonadetes bacterium]|nr:SDR family oxidoreductase [Gemmatimonadota bacterium]
MVFFLCFVAYAFGLSAALAQAGHRSRFNSPADEASATRPTRVLIVGATGGTGRQLVEQALERGFEVTALVRNAAKLGMDNRHLTVLQGDVMDEASVDAAVRGQDAVVSALGHKRFFSLARILSAGTRNILRSMETHGVPRFVCETSLGIGDSAGRMGLYYTLFVIPVILPLYYWDKTRQEKAIAGSSVDWVIVRPGALTNGERRGSSRHGRVGNWLWTARISRADTAAFMLDQLESNMYLKIAPGVVW